jgi:hypothetical protein
MLSRIYNDLEVWIRKVRRLDVMQIEVPTVCESSHMKKKIIDAMVIYLEQTIKHK